MKKSSKYSRRKLAIFATVATLLVGATAIKAYLFAAPPKKDKEKDCDFIFPKTDEGKDTTIETSSVSPLIFAQVGGTINDASCLNKTAVAGIVSVTTEEDIRAALSYAKENEVKVTSAGQRHSMGGQAFFPGGIVLDMRKFNGMKLDEQTKTLTVQTGALWADIQKFLDEKGLSVKAMQSINIFTVGGTLSVNAHGVAHNPGQIAPTVKSIRVMKADGSIVKASPTENTELFKHALGGYGLFGVILDVELEVVPNEAYKWKTTYVEYKDFPEFYKKNVEGNDQMGLMYARLAMSPLSYLTQVAVHTFEKTEYIEKLPDLKTDGHTWLNRLVINFSKTGGLGRFTRWTLEKYAEPRIHNCITRNQAMSQKEICLVSRNQEMYDAMKYLKNRLPDTDILQEYFIPQEKMPEFVEGLKRIVKEDKVNLLNVTIRIVSKDDITAMPYAPEDRFAFVLYFNQKFNEKESERLKNATSHLIDLATSLGGRYYLPYQLFYTEEQLHKAYPEAAAFFETKRKHDPQELFTNKWYEKYGKKK